MLGKEEKEQEASNTGDKQTGSNHPRPFFFFETWILQRQAYFCFRTVFGQLHQNAARASGWNYRKPFVFFLKLVAGVRFELTTFGL